MTFRRGRNELNDRQLTDYRVDLILRYLYLVVDQKIVLLQSENFSVQTFLDQSDSYFYLFILEPKYFLLISF